MAQQSFSLTVETKNFNKHIKQFLSKSNLSIAVIIKKFAFDLLARIVRKSPVDTGRSRAGWYVAMERLGGTVPIAKKGQKNVSANAILEGKAAGKFVSHIGYQYRNQWVELINGVGYVIYLEYGYSHQAPFGMVRISMRELRRGELPKNLSNQLKKDWNSFYSI